MNELLRTSQAQQQQHRLEQEGRKDMNFNDIEANAPGVGQKDNSRDDNQEEEPPTMASSIVSSIVSPFSSFQSSSHSPSPPLSPLHDDGDGDHQHHHEQEEDEQQAQQLLSSYGGLDGVNDDDGIEDDDIDIDNDDIGDDEDGGGGLSSAASVQIDDEDGVLAFYEEISASHQRKGPGGESGGGGRAPLLNFSMRADSFRSSTSSGTGTSHSSERSPLLLKHPLRGITRDTPTQLLLYRCWKVYGQALDKRPVVTKSITALIIVALGDVVGQYMEGPDEGETHVHFNYVRFCRFASMGMFVQAPITHYYYEALDRYFPPTENPWTKTTFMKLGIDQSIYAPGFLLCVFVYLGLLEGSSWKEIGEQLETNYFTTLRANWKLWIPATLINLAYCAPRYRVLYCNVIFFAWSIFLSLVLSPAGVKNG